MEATSPPDAVIWLSIGTVFGVDALVCKAAAERVSAEPPKNISEIKGRRKVTYKLTYVGRWSGRGDFFT
jgi:hypothetical protein